MSLQDWAGYQTLHDINYDEKEPYVLPIILHLEKDEMLTPSHEEAQLAVAHAVSLFFDSEKIINEGEWKLQVDKWLKGRIRKVARRARGNEWETVKSMNGIYASHGKAEVIILPPHPNFEPPAEIKKLQVSGLDLERKLQTETKTSGLQFTINPDIIMSTGKTLAQVGHAVQLAIFNSSPKIVNEWVSQQTPINICSWNAYNYWTAEIHDAGFTEIPANTLTAKAYIN